MADAEGEDIGHDLHQEQPLPSAQLRFLLHRRQKLRKGQGPGHFLPVGAFGLRCGKKGLAQGRQAVIGGGREKLCPQVMPHQHQSRQIIHQIVKPHRGEGDGTDEMEKDAHGGQEPFIQHNACKEEGGNDGAFLGVQVFRRGLPDAFDIHIDPLVKIHEKLVYLLMLLQPFIEKGGGGDAILQIHGIGEAFRRQHAGRFAKLEEDIRRGLGQKAFTFRRRLQPLGMDGGHGHEKPVEPGQAGQVFQIKFRIQGKLGQNFLSLLRQQEALGVRGTVRRAIGHQGL